VMSKSKGNTVAPDDVIARYGADTLRLYILSVAPPEMALEWSEESIAGSHRLIQRVWRLVDRHAPAPSGSPASAPGNALPAAARDLRRKVHQTIQRVTDDVDERLHLNTAVAAFHELVNEIYRVEEELAAGPGREVMRLAIETLVMLMNPFTPHVCEEMWRCLGHSQGLVDQSWPKADAALAREETIEMAVQVNGKVRGHLVVQRDAGEEAIRLKAQAEPRVAEHLRGKQVVKAVVVPGRLVSFVVR
jgi:leucyl-tRNA synthetase